MVRHSVPLGVKQAACVHHEGWAVITADNVVATTRAREAIRFEPQDITGATVVRGDGGVQAAANR